MAPSGASGPCSLPNLPTRSRFNVHYADDTFALYGGLFKEAHAALTKEGGAVSDWIAKKLSPKTFQRWTRGAEQAEQLQPTIDSMAEELLKRRSDQALHLGKIDSLANEVKTLGAKPGALSEAEQAATRARTGRNVALGVGAAGAGVGVPTAYMAGHGQGTADKTRTRNIAFGAGTAAGLAAPQLIRGLGSIARGAGQSGVFPEFEGAGGGYY